MTKRGLQAYGAACIVKFCAARSISNRHVDELVDHLLSLLSASSVTDWEQAGGRLAFAGRGDPLPDGHQHGMTLHLLVEYVVEIGRIDMYGADTNGPNEFVDRAIGILRDNGIEPPSYAELVELMAKTARMPGEIRCPRINAKKFDTGAGHSSDQLHAAHAWTTLPTLHWSKPRSGASLMRDQVPLESAYDCYFHDAATRDRATWAPRMA